ncbi:hypothetical protein F503_02817 [Ophiostoma piceae UAMH 11346]|uniref:Uncharacterized protein n=1 Tax=Ophiostoma piceae (strain UAMH 11346) TaxID=1262450 RepID=S3CI07_OPHP1|nr:hypothetical protein F503_02817 [Ophiostoma piceae UAMH 11346]
MPQPPASQPAQFSTPNPSKFRLPKRADERRVNPSEIPGSALPATIRPTQRFAPSWRRQSFLPQSQSQSQSASFAPTPSGVHPLRPPILRTEDTIEDGSSPPRAEDEGPAPEHEPELEPEPESIEIASTDESLLVVRNSPTVVRALTEYPRLIQRRRRDLQDDIEDVPASADAVPDDIVAESGEVEAVEDSGEMPVVVPDSFDLAATTPGLLQEYQEQQPRSSLPQQRSASRLLSSVQPFKRRRLFVPPGMITSSPGYEDHEADDTTQNENEEGVDRPRQRQSKRRRWDIDIDDDDDADDKSENGNTDGMDYEEIRDIVNYGELLEYGDSDDEVMQEATEGYGDGEYGAAYKDNEEDDDYSIFDRTPTRIRRARQEELQQEQEREQQTKSRPARATFPRAKLFMSARRMADDERDTDEAKRNDNDDEDDQMQVDATPRRQTTYAGYALPAPDFFSPQKKKRNSKRNAKNKNKTRQSINEEEDDSKAATVQPIQTTTTEQYVPGGLAAELRDWLVQIKNGSGMAASKEFSTDILGHYAVHALASVAGPSAGMRLAAVRQTSATTRTKITKAETATAAVDKMPEVRLLLAGEDKSAGARRAEPPLSTRSMSTLSSVSVAAPAWEVVLDGQAWVVASNWSGGHP